LLETLRRTNWQVAGFDLDGAGEILAKAPTNLILQKVHEQTQCQKEKSSPILRSYAQFAHCQA
jgi:hypothetical protein